MLGLLLIVVEVQIRVTKLSIYVMPLSRTRFENTKKQALCAMFHQKTNQNLAKFKKNIKFSVEKKKILG